MQRSPYQGQFKSNVASFDNSQTCATLRECKMQPYTSVL